jgi:hypothetical protein
LLEIIGVAMDTEEALYATVSDELRRGNIRPGLWAKALAEEGYDEQRAKARYLKLRVQSLRKEIAQVVSSEQARVRAHQKQQNEQAIQHQKQQNEQAIQLGFQQLGWRADSLSQQQRSRQRIRTVGFWLPFVVAILWSFLYLKLESKDESIIFALAAFFGLITGLLGFLVAEITRWFMPSQRQLEREEKDIKDTRANLEYAQKSGLGKFATNVFNFLLGLIGLVYVIALVVKQFAK